MLRRKRDPKFHYTIPGLSAAFRHPVSALSHRRLRPRESETTFSIALMEPRSNLGFSYTIAAF